MLQATPGMLVKPTLQGACNWWCQESLRSRGKKEIPGELRNVDRKSLSSFNLSFSVGSRRYPFRKNVDLNQALFKCLFANQLDRRFDPIFCLCSLLCSCSVSRCSKLFGLKTEFRQSVVSPPLCVLGEQRRIES